MDGRVADDAVVRAALADLELRLDEGDDRRRRRAAERRGDGPRTSAERDERDVDDGEVDRLAERLRVSACGRSSDHGRRRAGRGAIRSASWPRPTSTAWTRRRRAGAGRR